MIKLITGVAMAIAAICGLLTILYRHYLSPAAKRRRQALKDGKKAVSKGNVSGVTSAFDRLRRGVPIILLILIAGCSPPKVVLHPILTIDIIRVRQGEQIEAPVDGYFLSDRYISDVMEAKVE